MNDTTKQVDYLTVREVARRLAVSREHVRFLINSGELPAVQIGKRKLIVHIDDINTLLDKRTLNRAGAGGA